MSSSYRLGRILRRVAAASVSLLLAGSAVAEIPKPANDSEPYFVDDTIQRPVKTHSPAPTYSAEAKEHKIQGVVIMQVVIDRQGNVHSPQVLKGLPYGLSEQAVDAVSQWKFEPAQKDGKPVEVIYNLTINFRLEKAIDTANKTQRDAEPFYVTGDVVAPKRLTSTVADYTEVARKARVEGVVILQVVIDRQGKIKETNVLKGMPFGLSEQAVAAVSQWTFEPATRNGEPVEVYYNLTINFRLE